MAVCDKVELAGGDAGGDAMSETAKTIRDITAEMRKLGFQAAAEDHEKISGEALLVFADDIEAAEKNTVPTKLVLSVLRALLEGQSKKEKDDAILRLSRHFDENGRSELGSYVQAMAGLGQIWIPMDAGFGGEEAQNGGK